MEPDHAQEIAARDQFWATIRILQPAIEKLAAGEFANTDTDRQVIQLIARVVVAELSFRAKQAEPE
jgi:hypothetical protein